MASKKSKARASGKTVTIRVEAEALHALLDAVDSLSQFAAAWVTAVDDPDLRSELSKRSPKKRR